MDISIPEDETTIVSKRRAPITQRRGAMFQKKGALKGMSKLQRPKALHSFFYTVIGSFSNI
jgi:hypothetical protein